MDTVPLNDTRGIEPLSGDEVALVSGGKSTEPPKSLWERFCDWVSGLGSAPSNSPRSITMGELVMLQTACVQAGGASSLTISASSSGSDMTLINASGERLDIVLTCSPP